MSELKKEKILNILETAFSHLLKDINYKETRAKYEQAKEQIKALIQKPEVTEEWIEHKALEVMRLSSQYKSESYRRESVKDFIRKLVEEIHGRK